MELFVCSKCHCVDSVELAKPDPKTWLCSACQPNGRWHGQFDREVYNSEEDLVVNRATGVSL